MRVPRTHSVGVAHAREEAVARHVAVAAQPLVAVPFHGAAAGRCIVIHAHTHHTTHHAHAHHTSVRNRHRHHATVQEEHDAALCAPETHRGGPRGGGGALDIVTLYTPKSVQHVCCRQLRWGGWGVGATPRSTNRETITWLVAHGALH